MRRALALALAASLWGCATAGPTPEGFAPYHGRPTQAVSPEGVVFKARVEKNDPEADVAFWAEALVRRQTNAGYRLIGQSELSAGSLTGQVIELEAPLGAWDYTYLITLFVDGGDLHVIEAAGRVQDVAPHRDAILKAAAATVTGG